MQAPLHGLKKCNFNYFYSGMSAILKHIKYLHECSGPSLSIGVSNSFLLKMDVSRFEILLASIVFELHLYECPGQGIKLNVMLE